MLTAVPIPGKRKSSELCKAFIAGAPKSAKGFVFYGTLAEPLRIYRQALRDRVPCWLIDGSYFDSVRGQQFRATLNHLQLPGAHERESDGKRFDALGVTLKPWRKAPGYALACEQSDAFMRDIAEAPDWLKRHTNVLGGMTIRTRPWVRDKLNQQATLVEDLQGAELLVTHSSAAAVTALVEGVPVWTSRMSAVWNWTHENRRRLLGVLADNNFTIDELKDGTAWRLLNP